MKKPWIRELVSNVVNLAAQLVAAALMVIVRLPYLTTGSGRYALLREWGLIVLAVFMAAGATHYIVDKRLLKEGEWTE